MWALIVLEKNSADNYYSKTSHNKSGLLDCVPVLLEEIDRKL